VVINDLCWAVKKHCTVIRDHNHRTGDKLFSRHLKMAENRESGALPPGWDRKYDHRTGR